MKLYSSIIDRLNTQHLTIKELIRNLDEEIISEEPEPGKWSIHENLTHIVSYHQILLNRMEKIIKGDNPYFDRYKTEDEHNYIRWQNIKTEGLLTNLEEERKKVVDVIFQFNEEELRKKGTHQKFGEMNVFEWIEFFLLHEAHHIYTIFKLSRIN